MNNSKTTQYDEITELLMKENDYLQILNGYCENEMEKSIEIARIYRVICEICTLHEELHNKIDDLIINLS